MLFLDGPLTEMTSRSFFNTERFSGSGTEAPYRQINCHSTIKSQHITTYNQSLHMSCEFIGMLFKLSVGWLAASPCLQS